MTTTTTTATPAAPVAGGESFERIPIDLIVHSKTNPRKRRNPKKFADLVASIRTAGVIEPGIVRPHPKQTGKYELIVGSRRLDASREAGRDKFPAIIRNLPDDVVLEIQLIENAIREDVHALEEAESYATLLKLPGYTRAIIAEKVGHDPGHIAKRIQLLNLIEPAKKLFYDDVINIGHANAIAALDPDKQEIVVGKNSHDSLLFISGWDGGKHVETPVTVATLNDAIRTRILMDLSAAPWKRDDALLVATVGSCAACQKRTGANQFLFDEIAPKGDMCLDSKCFEAKGAAQLVQIQTTRPDVVKISRSYTPKEKGAMSCGSYEVVKKKKCDHAKPGLYVDGPERGHVVNICFAPTCKEHRYGHASTPSRPLTADGKLDYWKQREQALEGKIKLTSRRDQLAGILKQGLKPDANGYRIGRPLMRALCLVALENQVPQELIEAFPAGMFKTDGRTSSSAQLKAEVAKPNSDLHGTILLAVMMREVVREWGAGGDSVANMKRVGVAMGVDVEKIAAVTKTLMVDDFNAKRAKAKANKTAKAPKKVPYSGPQPGGKYKAAAPAAVKPTTKTKAKGKK